MLSELARQAAPGERLVIREPYPGEKMSSTPVNGANRITSYFE